MQNKNFKKLSATLVSAIFLGSCSAQNICFSKTNAPIIQHFDSSSSDHLDSNDSLDIDESVNDLNAPTILEQENENSIPSSNNVSKILQFMVKAARLSGKILLSVWKGWCYFIGTANMIMAIPFIMAVHKVEAEKPDLEPEEFIGKVISTMLGCQTY